ncbi:hypothetical protein TGME49_300110 [Toxoplasma gondii ME49]|uniref:Uncharacterized protein n=3 Tax=Toxoplasma gondii TaxID=5811 RepID=S8EQ36_TOXGM|nr:hypothetical protein TGME49_300110 [Toxoplasma gondii ME49]EPT25466.1 hypothetical protein TGME49_300110 [Toxoplasma gondii ME49]KYF39615.1 putative carnitine deficiency-associated protein [Toxoplasma gondii ARI]|eukprot:XP_002371734.1 hypothetical protein TGME49_300110 [Toxoplasma gondii ME49]
MADAASAACKPRSGCLPVALTPFTERKLKALACAMLEGERQADWEWTRDVVVWMEEEKIRLYPRHKRDAMRVVSDKHKWWTLMLQYCRDLEVQLDGEGPAPPCTPENLAGLLDVLSSVAIADIYEDALEGSELPIDCSSPLNALEKKAASVSSVERKRSEQTHADGIAEDLQALRQPLNSVLARMHLPLLQENAENGEIVSAVKAVAMRLKAPTGSEQGDEILQDMAVACPLPVENSAFFKAFVCGLRALHVESLRETQAEINQLIEALQALIADPVTDNRLGRVGI